MGENDDMQDREGFENVISKLKMLETAPAPADLTSRVMGRIEKAEAPGRGLAGIPIRQRFDLFIEYIRAGAAGSLEGELAVFTWLVASAHLLMALILSVGIEGQNLSLPVWVWIKFQPWLFFILAYWFVVIGLWVWKDGAASLQAYRMTVYVYVGIMLINGFIPVFVFQSPLFRIPFTGLALGSVVLGFFMAGAEHRRLQAY